MPDRWRTALCLGFALAAGAANAAELPPCSVGLHVPKAGGLNYPGTILAVDEAKGSYQVRMDGDGDTLWMSSRDLQFSCVGLPTGARDAKFFIGEWELFVWSPGSEGAAAPPISINADGTYVWVLDKTKAVRGTWREMDEGEVKYGTRTPALLLMKGYDDADWQVWSQGGIDRDNREQITVERMDMGLNYLATRALKKGFSINEMLTR